MPPYVRGAWRRGAQQNSSVQVGTAGSAVPACVAEAVLAVLSITATPVAPHHVSAALRRGEGPRPPGAEPSALWPLVPPASARAGTTEPVVPTNRISSCTLNGEGTRNALHRHHRFCRETRADREKT